MQHSVFPCLHSLNVGVNELHGFFVSVFSDSARLSELSRHQDRNRAFLDSCFLASGIDEICQMKHVVRQMRGLRLDRE